MSFLQIFRRTPITNATMGGGFLRKAIAPEVQKLFIAPRRKHTVPVGYRLGQSIHHDTNFPRKQTNRTRARRRARHAADIARKLHAMKAILPPQSGCRRPQFSSPINGRWAPAAGF